jgi:hypothetical protein
MQRAIAHPMSYLPRPLSQISFEHLNRFRLKNASFFCASTEKRFFIASQRLLFNGFIHDYTFQHLLVFSELWYGIKA